MSKIKYIELREHRPDWFEVKSWVETDTGDLINFTEADINSIDEARKISAHHIASSIINGCEKIEFIHTKP